MGDPQNPISETGIPSSAPYRIAEAMTAPEAQKRVARGKREARSPWRRHKSIEAPR